MVDAKGVFLVIDLDLSRRKIIIDNLKRRLIPEKYYPFNIQTYYSTDINLDKLRRFLSNLPFGGKKFVVFKNSGEMAKEVKEFLYKNIKEITENNYLVFEVEEDPFFFKRNKQFTKDKLFAYLLREAKVYGRSSFASIASSRKLIKMMQEKRLNDALYILESIFSKAGKNKDYIGMQILGAMTANFSRAGSPFRKREYFNLMWNTERILKRRKIESRAALEFLITKLILVKLNKIYVPGKTEISS